MSKNNYYIFFSYSKGVGPKTFLKLLSEFKTAEKIYNASQKDLEKSGLKGRNLEKYLKFKREFDLDKIVKEVKEKNIWVIPYEEFPNGIKNISNPPIILFGRGDRNLVLKANGIGIVGSRRPTSYGINITKSFTKDFVENNLTIISGMALGIDGIAHRTCLKSGGKTIAVLGSGVDLPTPSEHTDLYSEIIKNGGAVVSEFPLGMMPTKGSFPARNRIISALSQAILIPEATSDSGALITAKEAFSQGRKVFVVPGPITSNLSKGTNSLLNKGGIPIPNIEDVLKELSIKNKLLRKDKFENLSLTGGERKIILCLENENLTVDQISRKTKIPIEKLMTILSDLELRDVLKNNGSKWEIVK